MTTKELTTHEMLKIICEKIGYNLKSHWFDISLSNNFWHDIAKTTNGYQYEWKRDEREIIFTQEFMDKYKVHLVKHNSELLLKKDKYWQDWENELLINLDNPSLYLYNLIK